MKAMKHEVCTCFIFAIFIIVCPSISVPSPNTGQTIVLLMNDVLGNKGQSEAPVSSNNGHHRYSPKPATFSSPKNGVPSHRPSMSRASSSSSASWLPFLGRLQTLEPGMVTVIDEELLIGSQLQGKIQGIYVMSSENKNSSMVAMKAMFNGNNKDSTDSLRFFGLYQPTLKESHIAVIGGTGRYQDANGYAIVRSIPGSIKVLLFTVYLK
ncbi:Dirigent protein [Dioscorea alata]|uniref:Dirigent protein n=1 Tax=Dioscorea alata TaxID=55571 RepID=A0ACB7VG72_DIOAL|nr:Dirigent protein [Dioscorea alata]